MTVSVRTTHLGVYIHDGVDWQYDGAAYAASCSFGFDQRYAEATVRRTGGSALSINYWSRIELRLGTTPGQGEAVRFNGYVVPVDNALYPIDNVLTCKGNLYRAQWVRNQEPGGTALADPATGTSDQAQVQAVLTGCGVAFTGANVQGTGKALGSVYSGDPLDVFTAGPWAWAEGEPGLAVIERLDAISVPDAATGRYRTFESLAGTIYRVALATVPAATADFSFTEGVDVLDARITRDPEGAANKVTVTGAPLPGSAPLAGVPWTAIFTAGTSDAPYLPPGLPNGADGWPAVATSFSSPLIEKSEIADPGDVIACEAVAQFLLPEHNCVLDTLEFSTPRDDLLGPAQTIHLHSPRLGLTDPTRHYWLQHLEVEIDERGAFTQRLRCVRRS